jgi:hypothetical protein
MMFVFNRSSDLSENSLTSLIIYKTKDKTERKNCPVGNFSEGDGLQGWGKRAKNIRMWGKMMKKEEYGNFR